MSLRLKFSAPIEITEFLQMTLRLFYLCAAIGLGVSNLSFAQSDISKTVTTVMKFGDWRVQCQQIDSAEESCVMGSSLVDEKSGQEIVQANFAKNENGTLMTLILPLGVHLIPGVKIDVVDGQSEAFPISFCTREGCFVNQLVSKELVDSLRKKESATLTFASTATQLVALPFSIMGFLDAYKKL